MKYHEAYGAVCEGPFSFPMLEKQARELDKLLETDPELEYFKLGSPNTNSYQFYEGERADVSIITDNSVDRDKEVMDIKTADFSPLEETRLVAFNHNYTIPPIGKNIWIKKLDTRVLAKSQYASRPKDFPSEKEFFPDTIFHLIKERMMPGKSIGGVAKRYVPTSEEITANPSLKDAKFIRKNAKVYEYSVVTLNSNKNAIVEAVSKGVIKSSTELIDEFPELLDLIKKVEEDHTPLIKEYTTIEQYKKNVTDQLAVQLGSLNSQMPEVMDTVIARMLGKV